MVVGVEKSRTLPSYASISRQPRATILDIETQLNLQIKLRPNKIGITSAPPRPPPPKILYKPFQNLAKLAFVTAQPNLNLT